MQYEFKTFVGLGDIPAYVANQAASGWTLHSVIAGGSGWLVIMQRGQ